MKLFQFFKTSLHNEGPHPFFATRIGILTEYLFLALTGAFSAVIFPAMNWSLLAWIVLLPMIFLCRRCSVWGALLRGLTWGYFWSLCSFFWLREIAFPIPFILAFVLGAFPAMWAMFFRFIWQYLAYPVEDKLRGFEHCSALIPFRNPLNGIFFVLASAGAWCVLEWLRGWIMTGLPWDYLATSQWRNLPLIQICEFTGVFGVSFLIASVNIAFGLALITYRRAFIARKYQRPYPLIAALFAVLACYVAGLHLLRVNKINENNVRYVNIGLIQPDLSQRRNAGYEEAAEALVVCLKLSIDMLEQDKKLSNLVPVGNAPNRKLDLVIWPETAVPYAYRGGAYLSQLYRDGVSRLISTYKVPFLVGSIDFQIPGNSPEEYEVYNAALLITEPGGKVKDYFYKYHRVPFGEYVPYGNEFPKLNELVGMGRNLSSGKRFNPLEAVPGVRIGVSICYESVFPLISRGHAVNGANLLLTIANDAWYPTSWESDQHFANGLFRAIEMRLPQLRCGNSNYSALVSPTGEVLDTISLGKPERTYKVFRVPIPVDAKPTFYAKFGNVFIIFCGFIAFCAMISAFVNWKLYRTAQADAKVNKKIMEGENV